ncbi:DUF4129 domain-containing protein [Arthrobacter agilis]|uniref:DUF4129 domain-containing protein n=1 Tax=Arthrobacter agilis TaxID=37921 RepID=UPI002789E834|nr:DUF4129 domain-containing protein [Arthrobacter agilis]MDQ0735544.1 hypothetical protein [Arthrobacter agilis]
MLIAPDADEARRLLQEELAKPAYVEAQPNIFERILAEFLRGIGRLLDGVEGLGAGPGTLLVAVGAALVIVVAVVLIRPRLNARGRKQDTAVFDDGARRSAEHHRRRSAELASDRDWNGAVAELLRAIIRSAEERVVVEEQVGRTATEAAGQLGGAFPALAPDIARLADLFNETHYGSGTAGADDYRRAVELDGRLASEQPGRRTGTTTPAAPR